MADVATTLVTNLAIAMEVCLAIATAEDLVVVAALLDLVVVAVAISLVVAATVGIATAAAVSASNQVPNHELLQR